MGNIILMKPLNVQELQLVAKFYTLHFEIGQDNLKLILGFKMIRQQTRGTSETRVYLTNQVV